MDRRGTEEIVRLEATAPIDDIRITVPTTLVMLLTQPRPDTNTPSLIWQELEVEQRVREIKSVLAMVGCDVYNRGYYQNDDPDDRLVHPYALHVDVIPDGLWKWKHVLAEKMGLVGPMAGDHRWNPTSLLEETER